MDIVSVMAEVAAIQSSLSISEPAAVSVVKVWTYPPPLSYMISPQDCPAFINDWSFDRENRITQGLREQLYTVHMQLLVDGETDYDNA